MSAEVDNRLDGYLREEGAEPLQLSIGRVLFVAAIAGGAAIVAGRFNDPYAVLSIAFGACGVFMAIGVVTLNMQPQGQHRLNVGITAFVVIAALVAAYRGPLSIWLNTEDTQTACGLYLAQQATPASIRRGFTIPADRSPFDGGPAWSQ